MEYETIVVGSGPNGLAAAITIARTGRRVLVIEGKSTLGGGLRTQEITLPGFRHDLCSAIHPLGLGSPFFQSVPLERFGLEWIQAEIPVAHPLNDGTAVAQYRDLIQTADSIGTDGRNWVRLLEPLVEAWPRLAPALLSPLPLPRHPLALSRFGVNALLSARFLAEYRFANNRARALFAGHAAHSFLPLEAPLSASFGLVLAILGHAVGWPIARGGSQAIADAMIGYSKHLGVDFVAGWPIEFLDKLPPAKTLLLDVTPRQFLALAGDRLPTDYRRKLTAYRYGPGVFKIDYALNAPAPWTADACRRAGTVHVGGTLDDIAAGERAVVQGRHPDHPYVLVAQQSLFDDSRAPAGRHTLWAYCHVPHGSTVDMTARIEAQIERFAPGFRETILTRTTKTAAAMPSVNPNYIGGDINGGVQDLRQLWTRPVLRWPPYATPLKGVYLCSSSTPPGGGVHGLCGYHAARAALRRDLRG